MLNHGERRYFDALTAHIKKVLGVGVDIVPADHKSIIPMEEDEEVLGCCHKMMDDAGQAVAYLITVDDRTYGLVMQGGRLPIPPTPITS